MSPAEPTLSTPPAISALVALVLEGNERSSPDAIQPREEPDIFDSLVGDMQRAVAADPVITKMLELWPWLSALYTSTSPLTYDALTALVGDKARAEAWNDFSRRLTRLVAPALEEFAGSQEFQDLVNTLVAQALGTVTVDDVIDGCQEWLDDLLESDHGPRIVDSVYEAVDTGLSPGNIRSTSAMLKRVFTYLVPSDTASVWWLVMMKRIDPENVERQGAHEAHTYAYWFLDVFFDEEDPTVSHIVIDRLIRGALSPDGDALSPAHITDTVVSTLQQGLRFLCVQLLPADDARILTVREAAAFLGIRPSTFHTHVHKNAGTEKAIPVQLDKTGSGRGSYLIHLDDLMEWASNHYRPRVKRRGR